MCYHINFINIFKENNRINYRIIADSYLSHKWDDLSKYWYFKYWDGCSTEKLANSLRKGIAKLESENIVKGVPDITNPNWVYGNTKNELVRKGIFLYHLYYLLGLAETHRDAYIYDDSNPEVICQIQYDEFSYVDLSSSLYSEY